MSDELLEIVDNIKEPSAWIRVLFMIVFGIASYLLIPPLIIILSIVQALFTLLTGETNANLKYFSACLELYVSQIVKFLTYLSEEMPFPFSDFPEVEDTSLTDGAAIATVVKKANASPAGEEKPKAATTKKTAAKKAPAKKAAKKKAVKKTAKKAAAEKGEPAKKSTDQGSGNSSAGR